MCKDQMSYRYFLDMNSRKRERETHTKTCCGMTEPQLVLMVHVMAGLLVYPPPTRAQQCCRLEHHIIDLEAGTSTSIQSHLI